MTSAVPSPITTGFATIGTILIAMAFIALVEARIPLHHRTRWNGAHLWPNLMLTFITFATNLVLNAGLVLVLVELQASHFGALPWLALSPLAASIVVVVVLDFAYYVAHVAMHASGALWRFHSVHHSDPAVDVTTTIRQHPGEGVIRYAFTAAFAFALGAAPGAFTVYRVWSVLNGLLEHANIRMPRRLDGLLSLVIATPNMHKVHHSRSQNETNSNFGNIFSLFDRLFSTLTPSERGTTIAYGLVGLDDPTTQSVRGLLGLPFRGRSRSLGTQPAPVAR